MIRSIVLLFIIICRLITNVGMAVNQLELLDVQGQLSIDNSDIAAASIDFGGTTYGSPLAILSPSSAADVAALVHSSYLSNNPFPVSARGNGGSINGQARADGGVIIKMSSPDGTSARMAQPAYSSLLGHYVDVWGGTLWVDVLNWTLEHGNLAPKSWTDYLYLSVGGTLSNGGVSGQAFYHGPQISNVYELDVITGKGELVTCSEKLRPELFFGVLGGLGQFGIITRARIALEPAPQRVRWIRVLYSNFEAFRRDQVKLISLHGAQRFDYIEGSVIFDDGHIINNRRSSFLFRHNSVKITSVGADDGVLYRMEMTKNYDKSTSGNLDQEVEALLKNLEFIPSTVLTTDIPYVDFLNRVHHSELKLREKGLWEVPHPWLILFVPASQIAKFNMGIFHGIVRNKPSGPTLIYPMNNYKWDNRSSVVTPDEDVFYLVGFLRTAVPESDESTHSLENQRRQNKQILEFCQKTSIQVKQYLPHYTTQEEWQRHFGPGWGQFHRLKAEYDPKCILGTGQGIFHPPSSQSSSLPPS